MSVRVEAIYGDGQIVGGRVVDAFRQETLLMAVVEDDLRGGAEAVHMLPASAARGGVLRDDLRYVATVSSTYGPEPVLVLVRPA